jgi:putative membrane protein
MKNRSIVPSALLLATVLALPAGAADTLPNKDHKFVMDAAAGGLEEVQLGQLAAQKGASADVRSFGQQMVTDHSAANEKLKQVATSKGLTPPAQLTGEMKKDYDLLSQLSGAAFDRAYMDMMVKDHKKDVSDFEQESKTGKDTQIRAFASDTLPTLRHHLEMAQNVDKAVDKGSSAGSSHAGSHP